MHLNIKAILVEWQSELWDKYFNGTVVHTSCLTKTNIIQMWKVILVRFEKTKASLVILLCLNLNINLFYFENDKINMYLDIIAFLTFIHIKLSDSKARATKRLKPYGKQNFTLSSGPRRTWNHKDKRKFSTIF